MILAVGGRSYPGCGTTGDGYAIARRFGHTIVETRPALVPIRVEADWVAIAERTEPSRRRRVGPSASGRTACRQRREAILFAHFGLSGPAILDVSRAVARHDGPSRSYSGWTSSPRSRARISTRKLQAACRQGAVAVRRSCRPICPTVWPSACVAGGRHSRRPDGPGPVARRARSAWSTRSRP